MLKLADRAIPPLLLCAFRPFFLLAGLSATLAMVAWGLFLQGYIGLPAVIAGPVSWHGHEMVLGFGLAAVAGFALTAVPEFTSTPGIQPSVLGLLASLWLLARLGFVLGGLAGACLTAVAEILLVMSLISLLAPRLWHDPDRRHLAFFWSLLALLVVVGGYHRDVLTGAVGSRWLHASIGVMMVLMVVAMSRISMRIVNAALDGVFAGTAAGPDAYLARPPRRNLATFCISLYTILEFFFPASAVSGWVALAAAAAMLNLTNDWHVGRALIQRWVAMLYAVYWLMALGYGFMGMAILADLGTLSGARHLLAAGAMGLGVFVVMMIAGRAHAGRVPDERFWVVLVASMLVVAGLTRATAGWASPAVSLILPAVLWSVSFALFFAHAWPIMSRPRIDGQTGCAGVAAK